MYPRNVCTSHHRWSTARPIDKVSVVSAIRPSTNVQACSMVTRSLDGQDKSPSEGRAKSQRRLLRIRSSSPLNKKNSACSLPAYSGASDCSPHPAPASRVLGRPSGHACTSRARAGDLPDAALLLFDRHSQPAALEATSCWLACHVAQKKFPGMKMRGREDIYIPTYPSPKKAQTDSQTPWQHDSTEDISSLCSEKRPQVALTSTEHKGRRYESLTS